MLVAAALCPSPPLLARELTGFDPVVPELRAACLDAVRPLVSARPGIAVVVGEAGQAGEWDPDGRLDLSAFAPALARPDASRDASLPASLGLGSMLLDQIGFTGRRVLWSVTQDDAAADCAALGNRLAGLHDRVALLAMADGSARRTLKAPGYLDERSAPFDAAVERAVRTADADALMAIDPDLARELMATGRPVWQVLAGCMNGRAAAADIQYCGDPFGVFYLVASLACGGND